MNSIDFHNCAEELLLKQQALAKQMLVLLKQEYKILTTTAVEPLDIVSGDKQPVIIELNTLNQKFLDLLSTVEGSQMMLADNSSTNYGTEEISLLLANYDKINRSSLVALWLELQNIAKDCQKANTINGTVIALRQQSAKQTMAILRGQIPGDIIYSAQGKNSVGYAGGSALAKA